VGAEQSRAAEGKKERSRSSRSVPRPWVSTGPFRGEGSSVTGAAGHASHVVFSFSFVFFLFSKVPPSFTPFRPPFPSKVVLGPPEAHASVVDDRCSLSRYFLYAPCCFSIPGPIIPHANMHHLPLLDCTVQLMRASSRIQGSIRKCSPGVTQDKSRKSRLDHVSMRTIHSHGRQPFRRPSTPRTHPMAVNIGSIPLPLRNSCLYGTGKSRRQNLPHKIEPRYCWIKTIQGHNIQRLDLTGRRWKKIPGSYSIQVSDLWQDQPWVCSPTFSGGTLTSQDQV